MSSAGVDLTNCDREPIHQPGAVQPHGVLVACDEARAITHVSVNSASLLGVPAAELIGRPIGGLFRSMPPRELDEALRGDALDSTPVYLQSLNVDGTATMFDAIAHRHAGAVFVEFEPAEKGRETSASALYRLVQRSVALLQQARSVDVLARTCAEQVRRINGFDRVMVYRFDREWNGRVVAEERRADLEPFLGLHYPASDIPAQARDLYIRNRLRFIPDRDYAAARIVPEAGPESGRPLDLSHSVLRSVSPIHIEYLRNMGVAASMSISLVREGVLWGLIACHHYAPRFVPYDVRTACELLGQMMSQFLTAADDRELAAYRASMRRSAGGLVENVKRLDDTAKALIDSRPNLLSFIEADGAAVVYGDRVARVGQTPGEEEIRGLAEYVAGQADAAVFATDRLRERYGSGRLSLTASGLLAVSLAKRRPHQLMWFRTEQVRVVDWAGDPAKSVVKGDGEVRLGPRGSFALWKETVKGRSKPWTEAELEAAHLLRDAVMSQLLRRSEELAAANLDLRLASEEREKALESERAARAETERVSQVKDEFVATLSHELRTPLSAILGWAQLLRHKEGLDGDLTEGLDVIERNARSQAKMIEDLLDVSRIIAGKVRLDLQDTNLPAIIEAAIETVGLAAAAKEVRIERLIDPNAETHTTADPNRLQQVVWNLLSNAVKFTPKGGKVQVVLERVDSHVELTVSDTGQGIAAEFLPYVFDRFRQADGSMTRSHGGLGLGLAIVRDLVELHGGSVRVHSAGVGRGATFVVSLPIRAGGPPAGGKRTHPRSQSKPAARPAVPLTGVRALVLDDEPDARAMTRQLLEAAGCDVTERANLGEALAAGGAGSFDVVVSDIGMPGGDGYEFIRRWREQEAALTRPKTPAIALTAYARAEDRSRALLSGFQAHLAKPFEAAELFALVASLTGRVG